MDWSVAPLDNKLPSRCKQKSFSYSFPSVKDRNSFGFTLPQFRVVYKSKDLASDSPAFLELSATQGSKRTLIISQKLDLTKDNG